MHRLPLSALLVVLLALLPAVLASARTGGGGPLMEAPVTLLMAIHCHQPVGNFGFVFEEAYAKAYDPFLRVLERHPGVRLALHYSGCLVDWLLEQREKA